MSIDAISRGLQGIGGEVPGIKKTPAFSEEEKQGFGDMLQGALEEIGTLDNKADQMIAETMSGKKAHSPHELMITLEKADVAFELMNKVRQQLVRTYEEIMRTQV